jgi:acyl-CoA thioester hydrolase
MSATQLRAWVEQVRPEWIDYNGHLNDAQYVGVFSRAIDDVMVQVGMDGDYLAATGTSLFTLETHVRYLDQVLADARLSVSCRVIGVAAKVVWLWFEMESDGRLRATMEALMMHVDTVAGRSAPIPDQLSARFEALKVDPPDDAGRRIQVG